MTSTDMTLNEAADTLGVHYMTAYRYVRLGLLPAHKEGSSWRVDRDDVEQFLAGSSEPPAARGGARRAPWDKRLAQRLLEGDTAGAWGVVEAALTSGCDATDVYLEVLAPAMVLVGERWAAGQIDVGVEHRASGIMTRIIGRLGPRFNRRGRSRGTVVLASPPGEYHCLNLSLLADLGRGIGYDVLDLGADVPAASLLEMAEQSPRLVAVGIGVMSLQTRDAAADTIAAVHRQFPGLNVLVGGRGIDAKWVSGQPGGVFVPGGRAFVSLLDR